MLTLRIALRQQLASRRTTALSLIVLLVLALQFRPDVDHRERALAEARLRWQTQAVDHYVLEFQNADSLSECRQNIEVRDSTIVSAEIRSQPGLNLHDLCSLKPTVEGLFDMIEETNTYPRCGPNGCECDGVIALDVQYDDELGYPVEIRATLEDDGTRFSKWLIALVFNRRLPSCALTTFDGPHYIVRSLTPQG